ncbi:hypothetical protein AALA56_03035 [Streptococcus hyointestinalis]|uniref:type I restriction endonuclease subunit R, EcoR124 family n=1 Tax=Streptococcus hyointestinalis TaxID=1337 RepID=UPI003519A65B
MQVIFFTLERLRDYGRIRISFREETDSFNHLKAFTDYDPHILTENHFSQEEYEDYAAVYKNVLAELKTDEPGEGNANDRP